MPIYEYRCGSCGHQEEFIQKVSATPLTQCPKCGKETFSKMLTAAGFQLKGSGWYATDFRGGSKPAAPASGSEAGGSDAKPAAKPESADSAKPAAKSEGAEAAKPAAKPEPKGGGSTPGAD